eukprot:gene3074-6030_t
MFSNFKQKVYHEGILGGKIITIRLPNINLTVLHPLASDLKDLLQSIEANPFDYVAFLSLLNQIQELGDAKNEDLLESVREKFAARFTPDLIFWQSWLTDSIIKSNSKPCVKTEALFARAITFCPHMTLLVDFLDYIQKLLDEELIDESKARDSFEFVIKIGGLDILDAAQLWKRYRDFEVDEYEDLQEISTSADILYKAKERIIKLFRKQLFTPLIGNETVLQEFDTILSEICTESDEKLIDPKSLQINYEKAIEEREIRMTYEQHLISENYQSLNEFERIKSWKTYIKYEIDENNLYRAQRLYERALLEFFNSNDLWQEYIEFILYKLKDWNLLDISTSRAIISCSKNIQIWKLRFLAIELNSTSNIINNIDSNNEERVTEEMRKALQCKFSTAEDYLSIYHSVSDFYRRQLSKIINNCTSNPQYLTSSLTSTSTSTVDIMRNIYLLRSSFDETEMFLLTYYPDWLEGFLSVIKYRVHVEEDVVEVACTYLDDADGPEFEKQNGSIEELLEAQLKIKPKLAASVAKQQKELEEKELALAAKKAAKKTKKSIDAMNMIDSLPMAIDTGTDTVTTTSGNGNDTDTDVKSDIVPVTKKIKLDSRNTSPDTINQISSTTTETTVTTSTNSTRTTSSETETSTITSSSTSVPSHMITYEIFIKNLSFQATEEDILNFFQQQNNSSKLTPKFIEIIKNKNNKSKGLAHVRFDNENTMKEALLLNGMQILGRPIVIERFGGAQSSYEPNRALDPCTLYIDNVDRKTSDELLREVFETCGRVVEARMVKDPKTGKNKTHGLVQYESTESLQAALLKTWEISGHPVTVSQSWYPAISPIPKLSNKSQLNTNTSQSVTTNKDLKDSNENEKEKEKDSKKKKVTQKSSNLLTFKPRKFNLSSTTTTATPSGTAVAAHKKIDITTASGTNIDGGGDGNETIEQTSTSTSTLKKQEILGECSINYVAPTSNIVYIDLLPLQIQRLPRCSELMSIPHFRPAV